jgi:hypothetical protein
MQLKLFKYYLRFYNTTTSAWNYFYVDSNGVVQSTATKTELPQAPKGWDGQTLVWERGFQWYGVFTNYSNPLQFVNDGAKILKDRYYSQGIEAECQLLIERHTNEVSTWGYQEYYKGDIDFSRFKDMKDFVEVSIMESGFLAKLKSNESTTIEIPVENNPNVIWVNMDGINLRHITTFTGLTDEVHQNDSIYVFKIPSIVKYGTPKGVTFNAVPYDQLMTLDGDIANIYVNTGSVNQDIELVHDYSIYVYDVNSLGYFGYFYAIVQPDSPSPIAATNVYWILQGGFINPGGTFTFVGSDTQTITVPAGLALRVCIGMFTNNTYSSANSSLSFESKTNSLSLVGTLINKYQSTYIPALPSLTIATALCENIDQNVSTYSRPAIDYPAYLLTCGDALRNLPGSVLKTNFADYFSAINCMFNAAFYFDKANNEAQFLYKYFVFDPTGPIIDLGDVNNFEVTPLTEEMFSKLLIGYTEQSYDDYNGKDEFNTKYEFQSPLSRVTKDKNLVSPYRADMYGIELTRINFTDKQTTDPASDNDVFWLHIDDSAPAGTIPAGLPGAGQNYYNLYRDNTLTVTGVLSPSTAFNIDFSPKRRMYTWGYWIRSIMYPNISPDLVYKSTAVSQANNVGLETDDGVTIITEKLNEPINNLPGTSYTLESPNRNQVFYPLVFNIETKIPSNIMDLMTNPNNEIQFTYKGNTYYGWLLQVSDEPSFTPKQTYKLIASTSNNLTDLINGL